jgi:hypothetical protein
MALFIVILIKLNSYRTKQRHVNKMCCISLQLWFQEPCIHSVWHVALLRNGAGDDWWVIYGCGLIEATCMNATWSHKHNHWSMSHLTCLSVHFCMPHSCWYKTVDFRQWNIQNDKNFGSLSLIILWLKISVWSGENLNISHAHCLCLPLPLNSQTWNWSRPAKDYSVTL